jgi:hypothetical protein
MKGFIFLLTSLCCANVYAIDFQLFEESGKVGLKNDQGLVVLPPAFDALGWSDGSFSVIGQITGYKLNGNWGLINLKKEYITQAEFESLIFSGADRVVAVKKINSTSRKAGSLTLDGQVTIPFQYDAISLRGLRAIVMNKVGTEYRFGLTDLDNKLLIPVEYSNIYQVSPLRYAIQNKQGKQALFSDNGKRVTEFFIDSISLFKRDYAIIYSNGWQGVMDREGTVKANPAYTKIEIQSDGSIRAMQPDHWKILSDKNTELKILQADQLSAHSQNRYRIARAGLQGLIDKDLQLVWPLEYDFIGDEVSGLIPAKKNGRWGLLTVKQEVIIPFELDSLVWDGTYARGLSHSLNQEDQWWLYNVKQNLKSSKGYEAIEMLNDQFFKVKKKGYYGLISNEGKETVHCVYDAIRELKGNQVSVQFLKQFGIISTSEHWILPPQPYPLQLVNDTLYLERQLKTKFLKTIKGNITYFTENDVEIKAGYLLERLRDGTVKLVGLNGVELKQSPADQMVLTSNSDKQLRDGLQLFQGLGKFGFRDSRGRLQIPNRYDSAKPFSDQMAAFKLLGKWGYLNPEDKIMVNPSYDFAGDFHDGRAIVSKNKKWGVIDKSGVVNISLTYDFIERSKGQLRLLLNDKIGLATQEGKILVQPRYDYLEVLANNQILIGLHQKFGVVSIDGLNVVPTIYSSLEYDEAKNVYLAHLTAEWTTLQVDR